jgi:hypothetical protein
LVRRLNQKALSLLNKEDQQQSVVLVAPEQITLLLKNLKRCIMQHIMCPKIKMSKFSIYSLTRVAYLSHLDKFTNASVAAVEFRESSLMTVTGHRLRFG